MQNSKLTFKEGIKDGIPIALGYFFVSLGFGITAVNSGLSLLAAVIVSFTNVTSAGQVAGIEILTAGTSLGAAVVEMLLTEFVINLRYSLMSISLTQKLDSTFNTGNRLLVSFYITDEIFAVSSVKKDRIGVKYMLGLGLLPLACWSLGTVSGALLASWLPPEISAVFGIAIYGMFMSIVIPPAKKDRGILVCVLIALALSCMIFYIPAFDFITSGFSIIICAVVSSVICALIFPVKEIDGEGEGS